MLAFILIILQQISIDSCLQDTTIVCQKKIYRKGKYYLFAIFITVSLLITCGIWNDMCWGRWVHYINWF